MIEISTLSICSGNIQLINNSDKSDGNTLLSSSQATEKNQKSQYLNVLNHETEKERKYVVIASKNIIQDSKMENGYYEYSVTSLTDENGCVNIKKINDYLNEMGKQGWRLKCVTTNELGKEYRGVGFGGASTNINSTIEETILIFERFVEMLPPIN